MNAFLIPGGTPCIQMSCKQDIESIAGRAETGLEREGWRESAGEIKTNANITMGVTERKRRYAGKIEGDESEGEL